MPEPEINLSWAAKGSAFEHLMNGNCHKALASMLQACAMTKSIKRGRTIHSFIVKGGHLSCHYVSKAVLNMYAKCGHLGECKSLLNGIEARDHDSVFWNILLSGFALYRDCDVETLMLFNDMRRVSEAKPSSVTAAIILPVCARLGNVGGGEGIHCYGIKSGLDTDTLFGNSLISMYAKCGLVSTEAYRVFYGIQEKDVVSWNAIIAGFSENKMVDDAFRLFRLMIRNGMKPNHATTANILPICASLNKDVAYGFGKEIHCYSLRQNELLVYVSVSNALLSLYLRAGRVDKAELFFKKMPVRDLVSWNAIIAGYASNGEFSQALKFFYRILSVGTIEPDSITFVTVLSACTQSRNLVVGRKIHGYVIRHPFFCDDTSVGNALVNFYAKCDDIDSAYWIFSMISRKDLISWNSMLDAFANRANKTRFIELFQRFLMEKVRPDYITILEILNFCIDISTVDKVKEVHGYSLRCELTPSDAEPRLENAILDAYAKLGEIDCAFNVFHSLLEKKNLVTYNSMISGYVNCGLHDEAYMIFCDMLATDLTTWNLMVRAYSENDCPDQALDFFYELQAQGMKPDVMSIMSILPACAYLASADLTKQCHGYVFRSCFDDVHLEGALLDVYAKCGKINWAVKLFRSNPDRDLVMFTAMIGAYAMHGMGKEALETFSQMLKSGIKPDHIIITTVLSACRHSGVIDEGLKVFYSMENYNIKPTTELYSCVVDLLARKGQLKDAYLLLTRMPIKANANVWGTLLGACRTYNDVELGRLVANQLLNSETDDIGNYVVLSNLYASDARWDDVAEVRKLMKARDLKKPAGCSWIEVDRRKSAFVAGDSAHPQRSNIYRILSIVNRHIRETLFFTQPVDLQQR